MLILENSVLLTCYLRNTDQFIILTSNDLSEIDFIFLTYPVSQSILLPVHDVIKIK